MPNWSLNQKIRDRLSQPQGLAKTKVRVLILLTILSPLAATACSPSQPNPNQDSSTTVSPSSLPKTNTANLAIDAATLPTANLVEAVLADDTNAGDRAYTDLQAAMIKLTPVELGRSTEMVSELNQSLNEGWQADDRQAAAMAAVSLYASLLNAKNWTGSDIPLEVAMLHHAGLKSELLASATPTDWAEINATANTIQRDVGVIYKTLRDTKLKQMINGTAKNFALGARTKDLTMVKSAARDLLAAVGLLEQHYANKNGVPSSA